MTDPRNTGSTGNASNPNPEPAGTPPGQSESLLPGKAETYLREGGNIEDMPDPREAESGEVDGEDG